MPRQPPMCRMGQRQPAHQPRHADRQPGIHRVAKSQWLPVAHEPVRLRRGRCCLARVVGKEPARRAPGMVAALVLARPGARIVHQDESATPRPEDCGSTIPSTSTVAIAASIALPPRRRILRPASAAIGLAAATMCRCAVASGFSVHPVAASGASCAARCASAALLMPAATRNAATMAPAQNRRIIHLAPRAPLAQSSTSAR